MIRIAAIVMDASTGCVLCYVNLKTMLELVNQSLAYVNGVIWHPVVIFILFVAGILFTAWTRLVQIRSLTHGVAVALGQYDNCNDPGAITHFQALSAALSSTVGVGNIGGTALAIALGGPGALLWMWIVGFLGMALKMIEVTISLMYRTIDNETVHGGPMWVVDRGLRHATGDRMPWAGVLAALFCVTLLIATMTGGLFFQAWNAASVAERFFSVPRSVSGGILTLVVAAVILGGVKRIGTVASRIVPFMCGVYLLAALYVILVNAGQVPRLMQMIVQAAFSESTAAGAFVGGTAGAVFVRGMQQAFFSNEAGQGSSPIVHAAAKTELPAREGIVAGLEPLIDTIVVCTMTGLVILITGVWNRDVDIPLNLPAPISQGSAWQIPDTVPPEKKTGAWKEGEQVFCIVEAEWTEGGPIQRRQTQGKVVKANDILTIRWTPIPSFDQPSIKSTGVYENYAGASLTALAFDRAHPGLGRWLVTLATWLFGISTMISWSYYGEQGAHYLFGDRAVIPYRIVFCAGIFISCLGIIQSQTAIMHLANLGTGVMLWVNIPIMFLFAPRAIAHYHHYLRRLDAGDFDVDQQK